MRGRILLALLVLAILSATAQAIPIVKITNIDDVTTMPGESFEIVIELKNEGDSDADTEVRFQNLPDGITVSQTEGVKFIPGGLNIITKVRFDVAENVTPGVYEVQAFDNTPGDSYSFYNFTITVEPAPTTPTPTATPTTPAETPVGGPRMPGPGPIMFVAALIAAAMISRR